MSNMEFLRKLPIPQEIKKQYPLTEKMEKEKAARDREIAAVFSGESDKFILIIGPCSADHDDSVIDYISRLREVQEKVSDKILIIPRHLCKLKIFASHTCRIYHHNHFLTSISGRCVFIYYFLFQ